jgi:acyl carrier protein
MEPLNQSNSEILKRFAGIIAGSLHVDPARVTLDAYLDDLGAESLDLIEITMESEAAFDVWIPEKSILDTAIEVRGPGILARDGYLTEEGRRLMMRRLPEEEAEALPERISVQDLNRYFLKVSTWVRMISELAHQTPRVCAGCGAALAATPGLRMKCTACSREFPLRSGEELNREWVRGYFSNAVLPEVQTGTGQADKAVCTS